MRGLYLVRSDAAQDSLAVCPYLFPLRADNTYRSVAEKSLSYSIEPSGSLESFTLTQAGKNAHGLRIHVNSNRRPQAEVCPAARFSPLFCKLAVSNEFWEAALLLGCSLAVGLTLAPPSALPSQICPDVPSLSGAAPGGSVIARSSPPPSRLRAQAS